MMDEKYRELLAGYVDDELSESEKLDFERELSHSAELRAELQEFILLTEITKAMRYADIPEQEWESYWESLYKKSERGIGWTLFSGGAIVVLCFGMYELLFGLMINPDAPLWLQIGIPTMLAGAIIMLVSFVRERLFAWKRERYTEVKK